jgi:hypothetical protein
MKKRNIRVDPPTMDRTMSNYKAPETKVAPRTQWILLIVCVLIAIVVTPFIFGFEKTAIKYFS